MSFKEQWFLNKKPPNMPSPHYFAEVIRHSTDRIWVVNPGDDTAFGMAVFHTYDDFVKAFGLTNKGPDELGEPIGPDKAQYHLSYLGGG